MDKARRRAEAHIDVPLDVRADIAIVVQKIKPSYAQYMPDGSPVPKPTFNPGTCLFSQPISGTCWFTNYVGKLALEILGLRARIEIGGMVYRCGPDPHLDVVAFCGPDNLGEIDEKGVLLAHAWIIQDDDLIDFTPIHWPAEGRLAGLRALGVRYWSSMRAPQPKWTVRDPEPYFWRPHEALTGPWRNYGTPELGVAWYGPAKQTIGMTPPNELLLVRPHLERYLAELRIKERLEIVRE